FKVADGGTFFLDEVGDMSPAMQVKLLRVLQEGTFVPVGATKAERVDVRIIAATNRDLREMVARRQFREDLFYRLHVVNIEVAPLRQRVDDLPMPTGHFAALVEQGLSSDLATAVCQLEKDLIALGLRESHGNKSRLAARLGVSRTTLIKKIREYGLDQTDPGQTNPGIEE